jgi:hypothetical protein
MIQAMPKDAHRFAPMLLDGQGLLCAQPLADNMCPAEGQRDERQQLLEPCGVGNMRCFKTEAARLQTPEQRLNLPTPRIVRTGILSDRLHYMRWERQLRLRDKIIENIRERGLEAEFNGGRLNIVPPKLALPIVENASLEEDNELQDLWANLLTSALDPKFNGKVRMAFIDILKQLEVMDVHVLNLIYQEYRKWGVHQNLDDEYSSSPTVYSVAQMTVRDALSLGRNAYENSIDNLIRVRCVAPFIEELGNEVDIENTIDYRYYEVCLTSFGVSFVEACTNQLPKEGEQKSSKN